MARPQALVDHPQLWKTFLVFLLPLIATNILQNLSGTINTIFVGQMLGVEAIAAKSKINCNMYTYYLLKDLKLNERSEGTGQPLITQGLLNNIVMPKPKSELIFEFEKYVNKFFVQQNFYEKENQKFEELKELLLGRMVRVEN